MSKETFREKVVDTSNKAAILLFILGVIWQSTIVAGGAIVDFTIGKLIQDRMKKKYA